MLAKTISDSSMEKNLRAKMNVQKQVVSILSLSEFEKIGITGASAVRSRSGFVLSLPAQVFGCSFWRDHSDPAACATHYGNF